MSLPLHTQLDFPLNVYAHALYLQQGEVQYLHYGLVEAQEDAWVVGALTAQQRATELLLTQLPPPPAQILEVGLGLGTLASILINRGYQVTAISPDPSQIALSQPRLGDTAQLFCTTLENFTATKQFDVILLQESAQYIDSLTLFNQAQDLLKAHGVLLIADEVSLQRQPTEEVVGLPFLPYSLAQAERCGFQLTKHLDLSQQAAPTLDYLLTAITQHAPQLIIDLSLTEAVLQNLLQALRQYQQKYRAGLYGYVLLTWQKQGTPRWRVRAVTASQQDQVRQLFSQVFQQELSAEMWAWKYGNGHGMATAAWQDHEMVAHYGGLVRELLYFGSPQTGVQIVDVMVANSVRGVLTKRGPYFLVGATFPECYAGYGAKILLGYGFPTARAIRVAELLGIYADVGKMVEIRWETQPGQPKLWTRIRHLQPQDNLKDRELIDDLWAQLHPQLTQAIVVRRDWQYVQHRYLSHPQKHYELLLVTRRLTGTPLGIIVLYRDGDTCKLLDCIAPLQHLTILIQQARRLAGNWGMVTLSAWITETFAARFTATGGKIHPLDVRIPHCVWYVGPPAEEVRNHWWLMGGDTDFM